VFAAADGVRVRVRVKPGASRQAVLGRSVLADGSAVVVVTVTAPPEGGRANQAVGTLLAEAWDLPGRSVSVATGAAARTKLLAIDGDPARLLPRLLAWLERLPEI
jgi:uncharacterized protein YggU (UPF0235/DUF167 family)